nr:glycoside hydrolase family 3 N-terminal domain-containing protein [Candidatus Hamiltonella defensa]
MIRKLAWPCFQCLPHASIGLFWSALRALLPAAARPITCGTLPRPGYFCVIPSAVFSGVHVQGCLFSSIPEKVEESAEFFSRAYGKAGIACAYKHFPGHGSALGDTHLGFVDVTDTWKKKELKPYQYLLAQKDACPIVMTAHVVNRHLDPSGKPATLSKAIIQGKLRDEMGFQGIVSTDCMQMSAIADNYSLSEALKLSINAGADMLIFSNQQSPVWQNPADVIDLIYAHVKSGEIKSSRIESAYQRIIHLKKKLSDVDKNIANIIDTQ